jgi:8-oxo-dGTP diphosphatase
MDKFTKEIVDKFGNHLRIRICGLCIQNEHILLLKHHNLGQEGILWAPPGGGLKFGESIQAALEREFKEETNSTIEMGAFRFINEFIEPPLHAIELFYDVTLKDIPSLGKDPELSEELQLIHQLEWVPLKDINDSPIFHPILKKLINV